ncbi:RING/U-box protein with C6HC-type zinc finger [Euphorbia peplus]|nr:RING/U-box protein with C6HC-type zinc finger [Euphorbia peplus]
MATKRKRKETYATTCVICSEKTDFERIFSVPGCLHRYCFSCMRKHVQAKLFHGILPKCPHQGCTSELSLKSSTKFLTSELLETMRERIKEASIPVSYRVYCPYPRCSALMSKKEIDGSGAQKCLECPGFFCVSCKVPWHKNMSCARYKRLNPNAPAEDVELKSLATRNSWRQCVKCSYMIEFAGGCYHIICRCGFEFCYKCGAEWRKKKATCSCPIWDENYIWDDHHRN